MGFFGGPSKGFLLQMAQGVASIAMQLQYLNEMDGELRNEALTGMASNGLPTSMTELVMMAAHVIGEKNMGWYKKNQFLGMIYGSLVSMGMSRSDANYIKSQIELIVASPTII